MFPKEISNAIAEVLGTLEIKTGFAPNGFNSYNYIMIDTPLEGRVSICTDRDDGVNIYGEEELLSARRTIEDGLLHEPCDIVLQKDQDDIEKICHIVDVAKKAKQEMSSIF